LSRGPFIEVTPAYCRGSKPEVLFRELLGGSVDRSFLTAIDGDRPLYLHQEEAIRRVASGRNVVVATGTGSGKTESFLYPILLHLYREFAGGTLANNAGIRALILYPMNALAYDQRDRLGRLHTRLEDSRAKLRFSFGQYTGATPEDRNDTRRHASDALAHRFSGELVLRNEMRARPPQILLTNFSMLEYQLLRPKDSPLFDETHGRHWTFLVLDEAHQYRGTRGAEMSLLLRRLKQRLRENGNRQSFRCTATSASLAGGTGDREAVATFAANLFDEPFAAEDVILAKTEKITHKSGRRLAVQGYSQIRKAIETDDPIHLREFEATADAQHDLESLSVRERAGLLLAQDARIGLLHDSVSNGPREAIEIAGALFPDAAPEKRIGALSALSDALNRAEQPHFGGVFLSVRYHSFLRALEGAFVRYVPERVISLTPQGGSDENGFSFELALCRECG
jgi:ATP-dependent helicase YprA (DUF1998 family)